MDRFRGHDGNACDTCEKDDGCGCQHDRTPHPPQTRPNRRGDLAMHPESHEGTDHADRHDGVEGEVEPDQVEDLTQDARRRIGTGLDVLDDLDDVLDRVIALHREGRPEP